MRMPQTPISHGRVFSSLIPPPNASRREPGTGWDVPPGVLHAPGSLCTYEPQFASDVYAMYQSLTDDRPVPEELLWKDCPPEKRGDVDYLIEVIDWELNVDPDFAAHRFMRPVPVKNPVPGSSEKWICYRSNAVSAKEQRCPFHPTRRISCRNRRTSLP